MSRTPARATGLTAVLAVNLALTGCISSIAVDVPTLDRTATAQDALPSDVNLGDMGAVDAKPDTSRYAGELDGNLVHLTRSSIREYVCVILLDSASGYTTTCGSPVGLGVGNADVEVRLTSDGIIPKDDLTAGEPGEWSVLTEDVLVRAH